MEGRSEGGEECEEDGHVYDHALVYSGGEKFSGVEERKNEEDTGEMEERRRVAEE